MVSRNSPFCRRSMISFLVVGPLVDVPVDVLGGIDDFPEVPGEEPPERFGPMMDPGEVPGPDPVLQVRDVPVDPPDDEPVGALIGADDFPELPGEEPPECFEIPMCPGAPPGVGVPDDVVRVLGDVPEVGAFAAAAGPGSAGDGTPGCAPAVCS